MWKVVRSLMLLGSIAALLKYRGMSVSTADKATLNDPGQAFITAVRLSNLKKKKSSKDAWGCVKPSWRGPLFRLF